MSSLSVCSASVATSPSPVDVEYDLAVQLAPEVNPRTGKTVQWCIISAHGIPCDVVVRIAKMIGVIE
jgi:hypothetical protein